MFLPPELRPVPPPYEEPETSDPGNVATVIILALVAAMPLGPFAGGSLLAAMVALAKAW